MHRHPSATHHHPHPSQSSHRHSNNSHHHHHRHGHAHLHVHHHHHQAPSGGRGSPPLPGLGSSSPRREHESGRLHPNHNQHVTEVLSLSKPSMSHPQWKDESKSEYRDSRDSRVGHGARKPPSGTNHLMNIDEHDRPPPIPFSMSSTGVTSPRQPSVNGTGGPWPAEDAHRHSSAHYNDDRVPPRSPHRSTTGPGGSQARDRGLPSQTSRQSPPRLSNRDNRNPHPPTSPRPNSGVYHNSSRSPVRYSNSSRPDHSPTLSLKPNRAPSPPGSKMLSGTLPPPIPSASFSPRLSGPGGGSAGRSQLDEGLMHKNGLVPYSSGTPRTSSPFAPYSSSNPHPSLGGPGSRSLLGPYPNGGMPVDRDWHRERDREREPIERERERDYRPSSPLRFGPPPPPQLSSSKMNLPQMVEGR
jgi:hypothetical protein